jgi:RNA polymerase sigma-70 factor, ECF subfamily
VNVECPEESSGTQQEAGSRSAQASAPAAAMATPQEDLERLLAQFRPYLRSLVDSGVSPELQSKLDPSDLVQETLLRGYRKFHEYRGQSESELRAWLVAILNNYLTDVRRGYRHGVRDVRRERPLDDVACSNSKTLSEALVRAEEIARMRECVLALPADYRQVIELRQFEGLSFVEIGQRMNRSADAVRMLWARAAVVLGSRLNRDESLRPGSGS